MNINESQVKTLNWFNMSTKDNQGKQTNALWEIHIYIKNVVANEQDGGRCD